MHDPMVVVFDLPAPWPQREKWAERTAARRWGFDVRRRTNPEHLGQRVYPWWRAKGYTLMVAGRAFGMPTFATVWHVEPKGHDSGTVCKGMGGSDLTWHNVVWAWRHRAHLKINVEPYRRVRRWLFDRCDECGHRFFWKQGRHGYQSSDKVWHDKCMSLRHTRSQLDDAAKALQFTADSTTRWRVERWLSWRDEQAAKAKEQAS